MVQYSAGKLPARKLVSIWNLPELRRIEVSADEIRIGAGCTYTDLREHELINREFSLLSMSASWTGGIANQNRGTIGGNIVNASPAADSLPALMLYDAELLLVSARGERRLPYANFHITYRKTQLAPDELVRAICLKRQFSGYYAHARKVGARNAQAIAKVCLAGLGRLARRRCRRPSSCGGKCRAHSSSFDRDGTNRERQIGSIHISSSWRKQRQPRKSGRLMTFAPLRAIASAVVGNLVAEFLEQLSARSAQSERTRQVLAQWNALQPDKAAEEILPCCGSKAWAHGMAARRPLLDEPALLVACDEVWKGLAESDWLEAFRSHPRIGDSHSPAAAPPQSAAWSGEEQHKVEIAGEDIKLALADGNREYEQKFNRIFIVCATGKSAPDILEILRRRLSNDDATELREAAEQQRQIAHLRLRKWLSS